MLRLRLGLETAFRGTCERLQRPCRREVARDADPNLEEAALRTRLVTAVSDAYDAKVVRVGNAEGGEPIMRHVEKDVMLRMLDQHWREHLGAMDYLRQGIHLRGYAQKDYRFEYKREAFELFCRDARRVKFETVTVLAKIEVRTQDEIDREKRSVDFG